MVVVVVVLEENVVPHVFPVQLRLQCRECQTGCNNTQRVLETINSGISSEWVKPRVKLSLTTDSRTLPRNQHKPDNYKHDLDRLVGEYITYCKMLEINFQLLSLADQTRKRNEFRGINMRIKIIWWMDFWFGSI